MKPIQPGIMTLVGRAAQSRAACCNGLVMEESQIGARRSDAPYQARNDKTRIATRGPGVLANLVRFLVMCFALQPQMIPACSVPVFRYALERWPAARYELIVVCEGQLDRRGQELLSRLSGNEVPRDTFANLTVRTLDSRATPLEGLPGGLDIPSSGSLPTIVLRYPEEAAQRGVVWSGPFSEANLGRLLDSPLRRRIVQHLVRGDSAVWILLESGDAERDNASARLLQTRFEHNQRTLTLPKPEGDGNPDDLTVTNELKVAFSLLRLARDDPAEELLVRLLLGSEDDLNETEPMAFPIYGQGRILYALVGNGINLENIDEACSFLTGPCSCVIKEMNPGLDLLLSADWDRLIRPTWTSSDELFELTGHRVPFTATKPGGNQGTASPSARNSERAIVNRLHPPANFDAPMVFKHSLTLIGGLGTLVLTIGCCVLLRRRD
jgi:hypothetical protein